MGTIGIILAVGAAILLIRRYDRRAPNRGSRLAPPQETLDQRDPLVGDDLHFYAEKLARLSWGSRESNTTRDLVLDVEGLAEARSHAAIVDTMLVHVRRIAPGINVPFMTPRVVVGPLVEAAGLFSEQSGWVTLTVSQGFFDNRDAACAILCHELAHYVLNACGIRESERLRNERLTDVAMFVLGLGDVFLAGYKSAPTSYRPGHRLGYLSEQEYEFVDKYVFELHLHGTVQESQGAISERRLKAAIPDSGVRARLVASERQRMPTASEEAIIASVLDRYARDRGR